MRPGKTIWLALIAVAVLMTANCQRRDEALYQSAEKFWLTDQYEQAASNLKSLVAEYPESKLAARAYFRLGEIYYLYMDSPAKALDYFVKATQRPGATELEIKAHEYIAQIYENSNMDFDLAILEYQRILDKFGDKTQADKLHFKIARAYFSKSDYEQAIVEFQTLVEKFPESDLALDARYQVANLWFITGRIKKAIALFQKLLTDYPRSKYEYDIRLGLGMCYEEADDLRSALATYKKMRHDFPDRKLVAKKIVSIKKRIKSIKR